MREQRELRDGAGDTAALVDRAAWHDDSELVALVILEQGEWHAYRNTKFAPDEDPLAGAVERWQDRRMRSGPAASILVEAQLGLLAEARP